MFYEVNKVKTMVNVTKPLLTQETSVFRMKMRPLYWDWDSFQFGLSQSRMKVWTSLLHMLRDGNRSAYFLFAAFMLIIILILVANAIICDTEPGPQLHPDFERCQLLFQSETLFKQQEPTAKSKDSKWSGIKGSLPEKSYLLWNGNQNNQQAQWGRIFAAGAAQKAPVRCAGDTYSLCSTWKMGTQFPSQLGSFSHGSASNCWY